MKKIYTLFLIVLPVILNAQTHLEFDWNTQPEDASIYRISKYAGRLYFLANDGCHGLEPWVFDPITNKASLLADLQPGGGSSDAFAKYFYQGKIYFFTEYGIFRYDIEMDETEKISEIDYLNSAAGIGNKIYFVARNAQSGKAVITALNTETYSTEEINFSYGISETNLNPRLLVAHKGDLYFVGKNENDKDRVYRYLPSTDSLDVLPAPGEIINHELGHFPVIAMTSAEGKLLIGMSMQHLTGYNLCTYNDTTDQIVPLAPDRVSTNVLTVYNGAVYYLSTVGKFRKYDLNTGVYTTEFDIIPNVEEKILGVKVMEDELYIDVLANGIWKMFRQDTIGQFEPIPVLSDYNTTAVLNGSLIERINGQFIFKGKNTDGAICLMEYTPENPAPTMVNRITEANKGDIISTPVLLGNHGYIWKEAAGLIRFDTSGIANPVAMNTILGINPVNTPNLKVIGDELFLTNVELSQGTRYSFSVLHNGVDTLQHFLAGYQMAATQFTAFQGQVYFLTDSIISSNKVHRYHAGDSTIDTPFENGIEGTPMLLAATDLYLFIFTSKHIYRYDGTTIVQVPENLNINISTVFQPFYTGSKLLFENLIPGTSGEFERKELVSLHPESLEMHLIANSERDNDINTYTPTLHQGQCWMSTYIGNTAPFYRLDEMNDSLILVLENDNYLEGGIFTSVSFNGNLLVLQATSEFGFEWYRFDLPTMQMERLTDVNPLTGRGVLGNEAVLGSKLYFCGDDGIHGQELWSYRDCFSASLTSVPTEYGDSTGQITVLVNGGAEPFTFEWSNGGTGPTQTNLPAGIHQVTTTDANGCKSTLYACIESVVTATGVLETPAPLAIKVYPNPFGDWFSVEALEDDMQSYYIQLIDMQGNTLSSNYWESVQPLSFQGNGLPAGLYFLYLRNMGSSVTKTFRMVKTF